MMTDDRDPLLQSLFAETEQELDGETFTSQVMAQTRFLRYRAVAGLCCLALVLVGCAWLLAIPQEFAQFVAQVLSKSLINLGDGWIAWLFLPINNIGSLLVIGVKLIRVFRKKFIGVAYTN